MSEDPLDTFYDTPVCILVDIIAAQNLAKSLEERERLYAELVQAAKALLDGLPKHCWGDEECDLQDALDALEKE